jgi:arylformamidase
LEKLEITVSSKPYKIFLSQPIDISIPLLFDAEQPNFFGTPPANANAYQGNGFIGDTQRGGSCNVRQYSLIAHCNGTHTECVGHIVNQKISVQSILRDAFFAATLITIGPQKAATTSELYLPEKQSGDLMITENDIKNALGNQNKEFLTGLIIRTLPNDSFKMSRDYNQYPAPFFSIEAMDYISSLGIEHLLVDIPSVDRANDEGKTTCHHLFWGVKPGSKDIDERKASRKTITEMVFIPEPVKDGHYFVNIQIPPFVSDAAPSRPMLFKIKEMK